MDIKLEKELEFGSSKKASGISKKLILLIIKELGGIKALIPIFIFSLIKSFFQQYTFIFLENWAENFDNKGSPYKNLLEYGIIFAIRNLKNY